MRIKVSPLVAAAALGLLGPAALADDDDIEFDGLAGTWQRAGDNGLRASSPLPMGDRIEVIPFDGTVLLDDGANGPVGEWTVATDELASQQLCVDGQRVTRQFQADGDRLDVRTTMLVDNAPVEFLDTYIRYG